MYLLVTNVIDNDINTSTHTKLFTNKTSDVVCRYAKCIITTESYITVDVYEILVDNIRLIYWARKRI